jgi:hypothetical protein
MRRSGEERVRMACDMFDAARTLLRANLATEGGPVDETELKVQLFLRTYGSDFDAAERARIVTRLRADG